MMPRPGIEPSTASRLLPLNLSAFKAQAPGPDPTWLEVALASTHSATQHQVEV